MQRLAKSETKRHTPSPSSGMTYRETMTQTHSVNKGTPASPQTEKQQVGGVAKKTGTFKMTTSFSPGIAQDNRRAEPVATTSKSKKQDHAQNPNANFNANPQDESSDEGYVLKKTPKRRRPSDAPYKLSASDESDEEYAFKHSTKRRKNSDAPYKVSDPDESDEEYVLKKRQKRRKDSDGLFKVHESEEDPNDHNLYQSGNRSKKSATPPAKRLNGKKSTPSPSTQHLTKQKTGYKSPGSVLHSSQEHDHDNKWKVSASVQVTTIASATGNNAQPTEFPAGKKTQKAHNRKRKRGAEDRTYKARKGDESSDDDGLIQSTPKKVAKPKAAPRRVKTGGLAGMQALVTPQIVTPPMEKEHSVKSHQDESTTATSIKKEPSLARSNKNASPPKYVKQEPGSSKSNASSKVRRSSLYTKEKARRDAEPDSPLSDSDEPDAKRIRTDDMFTMSAYLDDLRQLKLEQLAQEQQGQKAEWLEGEMALYEKLLMREVDPQLPVTWKLDFPTLPLRRFAINDEDTPVKAVMTDDEQHPTNDFRAKKAFQELVSLGALARDKSSLRERPEKLLARGITQYVKWSLIDADLKDTYYLDRLVVVCDDTDVKMNPDLAVSKLEDRIQRLALLHRQEYIEDNNLKPRRVRIELEHDLELPMTPDTSGSLFSFGAGSSTAAREAQSQKPGVLQRLFSWTGLFGKSGPASKPQKKHIHESIEYDHNPEWYDSGSEVDSQAEYEMSEPELPNDMGVIYGILVTGLFVQVVSYNIAEPEAECHNIMVCDFSKETQDIWNSLAIAITVCHVRDEIMDIALKVQDSHESDFYDDDE